MKVTEHVYRRLRRNIDLAAAGWREGETIPNEIALAQSLKVARETLRSALKRLTAEGLLTVAANRRRVVSRPRPIVPHADRQTVRKELGRLFNSLPKNNLSQKSPASVECFCEECPALVEQLRERSTYTTSWGESLRQRGLTPYDLVLREPKPVRCYEIASDSRFDVAEVTRSLNIAADSEIYWLLRVRRDGDTPLAMQWCIVPLRPWGGPPLTITLGDMRPGGITKVYRKFGIHREFAAVSFRARRASAEDAYLLHIDVDAPVIEERRISYTIRPVRGRPKLLPYEFLLTLYTDRVQLRSAWSERTAEERKTQGGRADPGVSTRRRRKRNL
jgi:DNA-binding GntR family transcriptional regulator